LDLYGIVSRGQFLTWEDFFGNILKMKNLKFPETFHYLNLSPIEKS